MEFTDPQVILFVADCDRAARFYAAFGFRETFRSDEPEPAKVEVAFRGLSLGLARPEPARRAHALDPVVSGHRACVTLWTDDVAAAQTLAIAAGGRNRGELHEFLDGALLVGFVEDPDGHPVQFVQRRQPSR